MVEAITTQEKIIVKEGDEIQSEGLICEATIETIEPCSSQTNKLCTNVGIISDDEVLMKYL